MNATQSIAPKQRRQQSKPARSIRIEVRPEPNALGIVRITVGKQHADYFLTEIPADFGRGFKVEKIGLHVTEPGYHVNIDGDETLLRVQGHSCTAASAVMLTDSRP